MVDSIVISQMVCFKREVELNQLASKVDVMLKHMKFEDLYSEYCERLSYTTIICCE